MKKIYKFEIPVMDVFTVNMPAGAKILTVQTQFNKPVIWALVDTEESYYGKAFQLFGTGQTIEDAEGRRYIGTFQLDAGNFVGHLFEIIRG